MRCSMVARYEEYVVVFTTQMAPSLMTFGHLEPALWAIDERMAACLGQTQSSAPATY